MEVGGRIRQFDEPNSVVGGIKILNMFRGCPRLVHRVLNRVFERRR